MKPEDYYLPEIDTGLGNQQQLEEEQRLDHEERAARVSSILNTAITRHLTFEEINIVRDFCGL